MPKLFSYGVSTAEMEKMQFFLILAQNGKNRKGPPLGNFLAEMEKFFCLKSHQNCLRG